MEEKVCTICNKLQSIENYSKNWNNKYLKYYIKSECKSCHSKKQLDTYYTNSKKFNIKSKEYYHKNRDILKQKQLEYRNNNKEKIKLQQANWSKTERGIFLLKNKKYKRRINKLGANLVGSHTQQEWDDLIIRLEFKCVRCLKIFPKNKLTKDHIIPLFDIKNTSNSIHNIQPLCRSCNSIKNNKTINYING